MEKMSVEEACQVLGVDPSADIDAIKKAYRALALKNHPDTQKNNPDRQGEKDKVKTARFKTAAEAYAILTGKTGRISEDESTGNNEESLKEEEIQQKCEELLTTRSTKRGLKLVEDLYPYIFENTSVMAALGESMRKLNYYGTEQVSSFIRDIFCGIVGDAMVQGYLCDALLEIRDTEQGIQIVKALKPYIETNDVVCDTLGEALRKSNYGSTGGISSFIRDIFCAMARNERIQEHLCNSLLEIRSNIQGIKIVKALKPYIEINDVVCDKLGEALRSLNYGSTGEISSFIRNIFCAMAENERVQWHLCCALLQIRSNIQGKQIVNALAPYRTTNQVIAVTFSEASRSLSYSATREVSELIKRFI